VGPWVGALVTMKGWENGYAAGVVSGVWPPMKEGDIYAYEVAPLKNVTLARLYPGANAEQRTRGVRRRFEDRHERTGAFSWWKEEELALVGNGLEQMFRLLP
jgi:hypothetical protein